MKKSIWTKVKSERGLYRYNPSGQFFARVRFHGKIYRRKLDTEDLDLARRKLRAFKDGLERTDSTKGNSSFGKVLEDYSATLSVADATKAYKRAIIGKLKTTWFGIDTLPLRTVKPSQVKAWLAKHYGDLSASYYNSALTVIRDALELAVQDHVILESPAAALTYHRRKQPIRTTPTFEQFKAIVSEIRSQRFNADAEQSSDFIEFVGLAGLGQAEASAIKRSDVDLDSGQIIIYRHKTDVGFVIPIYPQLRPLVERLCHGKAHNARLFAVSQARKALRNACARLGFPSFTHRAMRRMFVTRAIERGVDVKVISEWQGHRDGGKLILQTYSHVRPEHSNRMAQLMSTDEPENVIPLPMPVAQ
jgi:integrase